MPPNPFCFCVQCRKRRKTTAPQHRIQEDGLQLAEHRRRNYNVEEDTYSDVTQYSYIRDEDLQDELENPDGGYSFIADDTDKNENSETSSNEGYNVISDVSQEDICGTNDCVFPVDFSGMTEYFNEYEERCRDEMEPIVDHSATNENVVQSPTSNYYDRAALQIQQPQQVAIREYTDHTEVQDETPTEFPPPTDDADGAACIPTEQAPVTHYYSTEENQHPEEKNKNKKQEDKSEVTEYGNPAGNQAAAAVQDPEYEDEDDDDIYGDVAGDDYEQIL